MRERWVPVVALGARPRVALAVVQTVSGLLLVAYVGSTVLRPNGSSSVLFDTWIGNLAYAGATVLCGWRAVAERRSRWAWAALALSLAFFTAGSVLWTSTIQFWKPVPYPSPADVCFLVFYPLAYLGLGLLIRAHRPKGTGAGWSDGLIAGMGVAALGASVVLGPISRATRGNTASVLTNLAYPVGDLLLVAMLVGFLAVRGRRPGSLWWFLTFGLVLFAVADSLYVWRVTSGTYVTGSPLDGMWAVAAFVLALAAWHGRPGRDHEGPPGQPIVVPVLFMVTSLAIMVLANWYDLLPAGMALASATLIASAARMAIGYRQLRNLADVRQQARTDELTGLRNRRGFYEALQSAVTEASDGGGHVVLVIDLDRFKEINDCLGHRVGDSVLSQIGSRLARAAGPATTVARLGGDEFALLVKGDHEAGVAAAARAQAALTQQVAVDGMSLQVEASIGIAFAPEHGHEADTLLQHADIAMYEAKRHHRGWAVYSPDRDFHSRDRLELAGALPQAIADGQIALLYQPKLDLASGRIIGVEALARWHHPTRGLLMPDAFIDLAEQTGQIDVLTARVLEAAVRQQAAWQHAGFELSMAVNLSALNLLDQGLSSKVARVLQTHGVHAGTLVLEVTEGALMADPAQAQELLGRLRLLGCAIAIDDYGTGFASLAYLRNLPVSELKLDRSFLADVTTDERARSIVQSTVDLAHSLGLRMVAEGVEAAETLDLLVAMGCDEAQGYYIGYPVTAAEVELAVSARGARVDAALAQPVA
ncbi:MAG: diguanylate cyclase [Actinomycetota bacterium]|jgi:diguanylate cyclase (GGDEF)-like protein|nr:diguanylate cyclase [Actinomycetota bacterium]